MSRSLESNWQWIVAALSGLSVEEIRSDGVQASLVAPHLTESIPEDRLDLIRLATGESFRSPDCLSSSDCCTWCKCLDCGY